MSQWGAKYLASRGQKAERINGKHQREFSFSRSLSLGLNTALKVAILVGCLFRWVFSFFFYLHTNAFFCGVFDGH